MDELIKQLETIQKGFEKVEKVQTLVNDIMDKFSGASENASVEVGKLNISLNQINSNSISELSEKMESYVGRIKTMFSGLEFVFTKAKDAFYNSLLEPVLKAFKSISDAPDGLINTLENIVSFVVTNSGPVIEFVSTIAGIIGTGLGLAIQFVSGLVQQLVVDVKNLFAPLVEMIEPLTSNKDLMDDFTIILGSLISGILLYEAYINATAIATKAWGVAQAVFNTIMSVNPIGLIIGGIIAMIALIGYIIYKTDGWGKQWQVLVQFMQNSWEVVKTALTYAWLNIEDAFMSGYETIMRGWYKVQALWDKDGASEALTKLDGDAAKRAAEIATAKANLDKAVQATKDGLSWELKWNNKSLADMLSDTKKVLGMSDASAIPGSPVPAPVGKQGKGGDLNNAAANITGGEQGAPQSKGITITIQKLIDQVNIHHEDFVDGVDELQEQVTNALINALNKVQKAY